MNSPTKEDKLKKLRERYANELFDKLNRIETLWVDAQSDLDPRLRDELNHCVHSLAGSAPTFGFKRLGIVLKDVEQRLRANADIKFDQDQVQQINNLLEEANHLAKQGTDTLSNDLSDQFAARQRKEKPVIVFLEDDVQLAEQTKHHLEHFGYDVKVFHSGESIMDTCYSLNPDVMVIDIRMPPGSASGPETILALENYTQINCPVIFASGYDTWDDRLSAVRAGGQAYLRKPINFNELVEELDNLTGRSKEEEFRIMIVDDNELLAQHYATVLSSSGMETRVVTNVEKILDEMPAFGPDLIIMDIYMPGCNGVEAAGVIRQHSGYTNLPIVYLSTESGLSKQLEALRVGGDDFLQKPISDLHLVSAVQIRAKRFRELSQLMNKDSLTGLLNHINLKLSLEREVAAVERHPAPLCFAMIDIDHFKSINDNYGHPEGDRVIKTLARLLTERLRQYDFAGRYGGEEFAVVMKNTSVEDGVKVVEDIKKTFSDIQFNVGEGHFSGTFSAGVAQWQPRMSMAELIVAADEALYEAKHQGRDRICTSMRNQSKSA